MRQVRPESVADGTKPGVTVVVPCYNYSRYLRASVGSALAQDGVDVNVVIVDDASTDDSAEVAEQLAAKDPRVRLIRHTRNQGHVETSNEALGYASGKYLVKLDADDLLTKGSLARSTALMERHPDVVFCYGFPLRFRGDPPSSYTTKVRSWTVWPGSEWIERVLRSGHNVISQPEVLLRREAVQATGGYRPQLRWAEDYNLWLRLATIGSIGRVNGATQGLYRVHDKSFQRSVRDIELTDLRARIAAVDLFLEECGPTLGNTARLRGIALTALAREARLQAAAKLAESPDDRAEMYEEIASELDSRSGVPSVASLSADRTIIGKVYRDILGRVRWRRWRRYGI
jgi:glycosyltransferase involved in cell wall biosynthesis